MKRLIVVSFVSVPLLVLAACTGDPTSSLRGGIVQLNPAPSQIFLQQGKTTNVDVTATDEQGNLVSSTFEPKDVGAGLAVERDLTFQPVYQSDGTLAAPAEAVMFRFKVTATGLAATNFKLSAGGKDVTVPVSVLPDPLLLPAATVTTAGATAADPTTVTLAPPLVFTPGSTVTFDAGAAIVTNVAADGSTITFFAPPATTSTGTITGVSLDYLPSADLTLVTDVPLTISPVVPGQPGTDDPATAPTIPIPPSGGNVAFYDGAPMAAAQCGGLSGVPCQLYKIVLTADAVLDASLGWSNAADLGLYVLDASVADEGQFCDGAGRGAGNQPEACSLTLTAGTYYLSVVNFGPFYAENDPNPDWISLSLTTE